MLVGPEKNFKFYVINYYFIMFQCCNYICSYGHLCIYKGLYFILLYDMDYNQLINVWIYLANKH